MEPFSLGEYLKNPERKIVTRDGRKVKRILCTDVAGPYPIVAVIDNSITDVALQYTTTGRFMTDEMDDGRDLFFVIEKHEGWINVYKYIDGRRESGGRIFKTKEEAEANSILTKGFQYQTTIKIEWEE